MTSEWTTTPPTEPGFYWVWSKEEEVPWMVDVCNINSQGEPPHLKMFYENQEYEVWEIFTHWKGPLPEPEPPQV